MQIDLGSILLALGGIAAMAGFAVVAGMVSARVFFDATRDSEER